MSPHILGSNLRKVVERIIGLLLFALHISVKALQL